MRCIEHKCKRKPNNYWRIRQFIKQPVIWELQSRTLEITPQEEQKEMLVIMKENTQKIIKNGLYAYHISELRPLRSDSYYERKYF